MITVVEFQDDQRKFNLHTAFCVTSPDIAKGHFEDALENSASDCQYPYISVIIYSDDGKTWIDTGIFKSVISALEWWEEKCSN